MKSERKEISFQIRVIFAMRCIPFCASILTQNILELAGADVIARSDRVYSISHTQWSDIENDSYEAYGREHVPVFIE